MIVIGQGTPHKNFLVDTDGSETIVDLGRGYGGACSPTEDRVLIQRYVSNTVGEVALVDYAGTEIWSSSGPKYIDSQVFFTPDGATGVTTRQNSIPGLSGSLHAFEISTGASNQITPDEALWHRPLGFLGRQ